MPSDQQPTYTLELARREALEAQRRYVQQLQDERDAQRRYMDELSEKLKHAEDLLAAMERSENSGPYAGMRPQAAVKQYLKEKGAWWDRAQTEKDLLEGGTAAGTEYPDVNVKRSIDACIRFGTVLERDGKLGLPDWEANS